MEIFHAYELVSKQNSQSASSSTSDSSEFPVLPSVIIYSKQNWGSNIKFWTSAILKYCHLVSCLFKSKYVYPMLAWTYSWMLVNFSNPSNIPLILLNVQSSWGNNNPQPFGQWFPDTFDIRCLVSYIWIRMFHIYFSTKHSITYATAFSRTIFKSAQLH